MIYDLIVRGQLVLEDRIVSGEAGVTKGVIEEISDRQGKLEGKRLIDFQQQYVFAGMIDGHVHCFSNPNEGFTATSTAAAFGGITTLLDMPYDVPDPVFNAARFADKRSRLEREAIVDIGLWATIAKSGGAEHIASLAEAGAVAFKLSTFETDAYRFPKISDPNIMEAMDHIHKTGLRVAFHAENDDLIHDAISRREFSGRTEPQAHAGTRQPVTETSEVLKLLEFAYWTGVKLHIVHVSHPRTIELIAIFKRMGVDVTTEICYPHLLLDTSALDISGPKAKINPPLRLPADIAGLWKQLRSGAVEMVASDHAPWGADKKDPGKMNIFHAASGMPGIEIMVPLLFDRAVVQNGVDPVLFAQWLSSRPAEVYGISGKGQIKPGFDADFTVIDPSIRWTIDESQLHSEAKLSPFHDYELQGRVTHTIVRGTTVYDGSKVLVQPGFGQFVAGAAMKKKVPL